MKERVMLITKDATCKSYLLAYGNKYVKMSNLEALAMKGIKFNRFCTIVPPTAMSFVAFNTHQNPYPTEYKTYAK